MEYQKPTLVRLALALRAIQGTTSKPVGIPDSASPNLPSPAAYEADE
jgi:hypothetical protein